MFPAEGVNADQTQELTYTEKDAICEADGTNADQGISPLGRQWMEFFWQTAENLNAMDKLQGFLRYALRCVYLYDDIEKKFLSSDKTKNFDFCYFLREQKECLKELAHEYDLRKGVIDDNFKLEIDKVLRTCLAIGIKTGTMRVEEKYSTKFGELVDNIKSIFNNLHGFIKRSIDKNYDKNNEIRNEIQNLANDIEYDEDRIYYDFYLEFMLHTLRSSSDQESAFNINTMRSIELVIKVMFIIGLESGEECAQSQVLARSGPTLGW